MALFFLPVSQSAPESRINPDYSGIVHHLFCVLAPSVFDALLHGSARLSHPSHRTSLAVLQLPVARVHLHLAFRTLSSEDSEAAARQPVLSHTHLQPSRISFNEVFCKLVVIRDEERRVEGGKKAQSPPLRIKEHLKHVL